MGSRMRQAQEARITCFQSCVGFGGSTTEVKGWGVESEDTMGQGYLKDVLSANRQQEVEQAGTRQTHQSRTPRQMGMIAWCDPVWASLAPPALSSFLWLLSDSLCPCPGPTARSGVGDRVEITVLSITAAHGSLGPAASGGPTMSPGNHFMSHPPASHPGKLLGTPSLGLLP